MLASDAARPTGIPSPAVTRRPNAITRRPLIAYFALAFAGTWLVLLPAALSQGLYGLGLLPFAVPEEAAFLLVMLSAYTGPLLAAIVVTAAIEGRAGLRRLRSQIGLWRVGLVWWLIALLAPAAIWLAAYSAVLNGLPLLNLIREWPLLLTAFLPNLLIGLLLPSLGEETGWRGFALPRLQQRYGPVAATLILGTLHSFWHLPAFFTAGLGPFAGPKFVAFLLTGAAATFLYTWLFNNARGSVLIAIFFHSSFNAAANLVGQLIPADAPFSNLARALADDGWLNALAFGLAALVLLAATRGRLGYQTTAEPPQVAVSQPSAAP
jgi:membrane protease YdiL (CAAX protease family)